VRHGIEAHLSVIPILEEVDHCELNDLHEDFLELQQDLVKLHWYNRVNQHAVYKVYNKIEKFSEVLGQSHHDQKSRWLKLQLACETQLLKDVERLNKLADDVRLAYSRAHSSSAYRSLYLENICCQQCPSLVCPDGAYRAIRTDQASDLAKLLE
jgi:hypothetical protein